ncbi:hypothetical protein [uncultured Winogradskyella sp.]|uniref:hypothetical protein n=1 Tax=uncultured Winogradskyella sp. TaxID=395353 RepID=UPI002603BF10|nr:hypothetical protein [uncultured Winogradskyella sp.]
MKHFTLIFAFALSIISCEDKSKPISLDDTIETTVEKDRTKIEIADLPIVIGSTDYLIHPIGYITEYSSRFTSYSGNRSSTYYSNYNNFSIKGEFSNLKFQQLNSEKMTSLTDKIVEITSVRFLDDIRQQTGLQYMV